MNKLQELITLMLFSGIIVASDKSAHHNIAKSNKKRSKLNGDIAERSAWATFNSGVEYPYVKEDTSRGSRGLKVDRFKEQRN